MEGVLFGLLGEIQRSRSVKKDDQPVPVTFTLGELGTIYGCVTAVIEAASAQGGGDQAFMQEVIDVRHKIEATGAAFQARDGN